MGRTISKSHPDHELLALCATWRANIKAFDRLPVATPGDEADAFFMRNVVSLFCRIAKIKARTVEGTAAKARVLWKNIEVAQDWPDGAEGKLLRSILREVMALASPPAVETKAAA